MDSMLVNPLELPALVLLWAVGVVVVGFVVVFALRRLAAALARLIW